MTIFTNQTKKVRKAAAVMGAILAVVALAALLLFLMNKEAVICYFSKEPAKQEIFENVEIPEEKMETEAEKEPENDKKSEPLLLEKDKDGSETDDLRIHGFPYIKMTNQMKTGDYVDVRISFADGGDFILLSKKQIKGIAPLNSEGCDALWFIVSEEEILRLSSAVVDAYLNDGCSIYAIQYISDSQKPAVVNYAASDLVKQLMEENPNIVEKAENVMEWPRWDNYEKDIQRGAAYPVQEEIMYMD